VLARAFYRWGRKLAAAAEGRTVRPFEWGLEWVPGLEPGEGDPRERLIAWADRTVAESHEFYALPSIADYTLTGERLTFQSAVVTPHATNNTVVARYFPDRSPKGRRRAVLVLPQWNADAEGHIGLCRLMNRFGLSALRLSLPYHDVRMPPELTRADYIVSANVGRTLAVCRQAVLDARHAIAWLKLQGYESIGILGTSLGSCLSMLATAHEPLVKAAALNHISPYFADVIWEGISTAHVRESLEGSIDLESLRRIWLPISPYPFLDRVRDRQTLLVYALFDLTFPVSLSRLLVSEFRMRNVPHETVALPCGHYSTGVTPFKWMDGLALCRFLNRALP
jgi:hypothetical protein